YFVPVTWKEWVLPFTSIGGMEFCIYRETLSRFRAPLHRCWWLYADGRPADGITRNVCGR
ncbi:hypothetical protein ABLN67_04540, partial [Mycobacterium tuberculosis]